MKIIFLMFFNDINYAMTAKSSPLRWALNVIIYSFASPTWGQASPYIPLNGSLTLRSDSN